MDGGNMGSAAMLVLAVAFAPLAVVSARRIFPSLRPPRHRPFLFCISGALMLLFGAMSGLVTYAYLKSGIVHFTSRLFGEIHADASEQPIEYWAVILALYGIAVFLSGFGLAGFGLCFRESHRN